MCSRSLFNLPDLVGQALDQVAIMGNEQDRAVELLQDRLQDLLRRDVQMVGRLVEQQQIGTRRRQQGQSQTAAFAAA